MKTTCNLTPADRRVADRIAAAVSDRVCATVSDLAARVPADLTFPQLLDEYAAAVNDSHADPANIAAHAAAAALLYHLSAVVARSVVNKVIDPRRKYDAAAREKSGNTTVDNSGYSPALLDVRRDIGNDLTIVSFQMRGHLYAAEIRHNSNGDPVHTVIDNDSDTAADTAAELTTGDGLDMVHAAAAALLSETAACIDRNGSVDLTAPFDIRRLKKQVLIKSENAPAPQWETVTTTPIQQVFAAVRRHIMQSRAASTDPRNGYTYIDDYVIDGDTDSIDRVYYRCAKYADIGGNAGGLYSADLVAYRDTDNIISRLGLTARQATVLNLRLAGHGYKSIAAYLNITQRGVAKQCELIAAKAEKIGFTPANIAAHAAELSELYELDGLTPVAVALDEKAARVRAEYNPDRVTAELSHAAALAIADRIAAAIIAAPALDKKTAAAIAAAEKIDNAHAAKRRRAEYDRAAAAEKTAAAEKSRAAAIAAAPALKTMYTTDLLIAQSHAAHAAALACADRIAAAVALAFGVDPATIDNDISRPITGGREYHAPTLIQQDSAEKAEKAAAAERQRAAFAAAEKEKEERARAAMTAADHAFRADIAAANDRYFAELAKAEKAARAGKSDIAAEIRAYAAAKLKKDSRAAAEKRNKAKKA